MTKPSLELLKKALEACADAHHVELHFWSEEQQLGIHSESVPVVSDVRMICSALFGDSRMVETGWGYTTVFLEEAAFLPEADKALLLMALPHGISL